jgi:hypothetical protein
MVMSNQWGEAPRVVLAVAGMGPDPVVFRWQGRIRQACRAGLALAVAATTLLGLVQVPGGLATGASAEPAPSAAATAARL